MAVIRDDARFGRDPAQRLCGFVFWLSLGLRLRLGREDEPDLYLACGQVVGDGDECRLHKCCDNDCVQKRHARCTCEFSCGLALPLALRSERRRHHWGLYPSGLNSRRSPGWHASAAQIFSSVANRTPFTCPDLSSERLASVMPTISASSFERILRRASITSRLTMMAITRSFRSRQPCASPPPSRAR